MKTVRGAIAYAILFSTITLAGLAVGAAPALAEGHGGGEEKAAESPYIPIDDLNVTIFSDRRARGIMSIALSLEVTDTAKQGEVTARQPVLQDAYFRAMTRYAGTRSDVDQPINIGQINAVLQRTTDKVLGGNFAKVLISAAAIRKL